MNVIARARRSDGWWAVEVPEVPGLFTQARRLDLVEGQVRDAADLLGVDVAGVAVEPVLDDTAGDRLQALAEGASELRRVQSEVAEQTRATARVLQEQGFSPKDIGRLMHLSPHQVAQLTAN